jgi:hypothetical protein
MQLTSEQLEIIQSEGDIKINTIAGSGKTTIIVEYAITPARHSIHIPETLLPEGINNSKVINRI